MIVDTSEASTISASAEGSPGLPLTALNDCGLQKFTNWSGFCGGGPRPTPAQPTGCSKESTCPHCTHDTSKRLLAAPQYLHRAVGEILQSVICGPLLRHRELSAPLMRFRSRLSRRKTLHAPEPSCFSNRKDRRSPRRCLTRGCALVAARPHRSRAIRPAYIALIDGRIPPGSLSAVKQITPPVPTTPSFRFGQKCERIPPRSGHCICETPQAKHLRRGQVSRASMKPSSSRSLARHFPVCSLIYLGSAPPFHQYKRMNNVGFQYEVRRYSRIWALS